MSDLLNPMQQLELAQWCVENHEGVTTTTLDDADEIIRKALGGEEAARPEAAPAE